MELKAVRPYGTFHARVTRDPTAMDRDGQVFVLINHLESRDARDETVEVMFMDGFWMLAKPEDLELLVPPHTYAAPMVSSKDRR